jgi:hypothetical protein
MGKTLEPGTLIHGTMRHEDLIPAFVEALRALDKGTLRPAQEDILDDITRNMAHPGWYETEDADLALHEDLFFILCGYAPEGYYFGTHNANSSDWGCWPCDEEMEEL